MKINNTPDFLYDVRLMERHITAGKITRKDAEAFLRTLPDVEEKVQVIPLEAIFDLPENDTEEDDS
jgi:hypothetical protein